ncbi:hypothetical protein HDU93_007466 [Gonapodya sp. JEL0774]|nr:hypothetical protein HDU93_007466 [Gonapodya sp. JEL0774]
MVLEQVEDMRHPLSAPHATRALAFACATLEPTSPAPVQATPRCRKSSHAAGAGAGMPSVRSLISQHDLGARETPAEGNASETKGRSGWWRRTLRRARVMRDSVTARATATMTEAAGEGVRRATASTADVRVTATSEATTSSESAESLAMMPRTERDCPQPSPTNERAPTGSSTALAIDTSREALPLAAGSGYHACRHPVVLCHGLFGFDTRGPASIPALQVHYWNEIIVSLRRLGVAVHAARVPKTGGVRSRAQALDSLLRDRVGSGEVNLLAHSMGGLDCRFLISHLHRTHTLTISNPRGASGDTESVQAPTQVAAPAAPRYKVKSLTTVATPHRGSSFMDWLHETVGLGRVHDADYNGLLSDSTPSPDSTSTKSSASPSSHFTSHALARTHVQPPLPWLAGLVSSLDRPGYTHLTSGFCERFFNSRVTPDDPEVAYFSYASHLPSPPISNPLSFSHHIISLREGANDGLVSLDSARWGKVVRVVEGVDHWDLNGRWRITGKRDGWRAEDFWMEVVGNLWKEGF